MCSWVAQEQENWLHNSEFLAFLLVPETAVPNTGPGCDVGRLEFWRVTFPASSASRLRFLDWEGEAMVCVGERA